MAWVIFHKFLQKQENGNNIDLDAADLRCMLVTNSATITQASDEVIDTHDDYEVSGTGYTAGGYDLTGLDISLAAGTVTFDVGDPTWSQDAGGFSNARYAIIYEYSGTPANDKVVCYANLGGDKGNVDGDLTLEISASGVFQKTCS